MFNDTDGGYFNPDNSFGGGSPQVQKKGEQKRAQNIMPVTAKQVRTCPDDGLKIGSLDVYLVTLVGIVRSVEASSVKITYTIEDDTGCIDGVHWIDGEENGPSAQPQVVENTYCRLSGTIRTHANKRFIMAFNIQQIEDFNEITTHHLEVALFWKKAAMSGTEGGVMDSNGGNETSSHGASNVLSNSLMTSSVAQSANFAGLSNAQSKVLRAIQLCTVENGLHLDSLVEQLQGSVSRVDVTSAVEFLCGEGHIYTTIDENHYRSTETM